MKSNAKQRYGETNFKKGKTESTIKIIVFTTFFFFLLLTRKWLLTLSSALKRQQIPAKTLSYIYQTTRRQFP
jgi:hypothetical protein